MARELLFLLAAFGKGNDSDFSLGHQNFLPMMAALQAPVQRQPEHQHLQTPEGQNRPQTLKGEEQREGEGDREYRAEEENGRARRQRAIGNQYDALVQALLRGRGRIVKEADSSGNTNTCAFAARALRALAEKL
jgi:hypothetical protein